MPDELCVDAVPISHKAGESHDAAASTLLWLRQLREVRLLNTRLSDRLGRRINMHFHLDVCGPVFTFSVAPRWRATSQESPDEHSHKLHVLGASATAMIDERCPQATACLAHLSGFSDSIACWPRTAVLKPTAFGDKSKK
eukprot:2809327-Pleurochrysis_carterae.AAC.1